MMVAADWRPRRMVVVPLHVLLLVAIIVTSITSTSAFPVHHNRVVYPVVVQLGQWQQHPSPHQQSSRPHLSRSVLVSWRTTAVALSSSPLRDNDKEFDTNNSSNSKESSSSQQQQQEKKDIDQLRNEAEQLREQAMAIRKELVQQQVTDDNNNNSGSPVSEPQQQGPSRSAAISAAQPTATNTSTRLSPWNVDPTDLPAAAADKAGHYRLYLDIGREDGTWMEPRWGASGRRIECTLDVLLDPGTPAPQDVQDKMIQDNLGGNRGAVYMIHTAKSARLRQGFDAMACSGGAYRIDSGSSAMKSTSSTLRFYVEVEGAGNQQQQQQEDGYGDVSIPPGCLYFSLPVFGNSIRQLSQKEGIVTVRQIGWHTGWRRMESRIVGTFRAVPIEQAQKRDGF